MSIEIKKSEKPVIYEDAKKMMEERLLNVDQNKSNELIWTLEHPDIYTAGTSYNENDILEKSIKILEIQKEGKSRQQIDQFLLGNKIKIGESID